MEIGNREQIFFAFLNPCLSLSILAFWTMTVPAAVVAYADLTAGVAPVHMTAQGGGTTTADGMQGTKNIPVGLMPVGKLTAEAFNDLRQLESKPQSV
jgi:hypothetical protein